MRTALVPLLSRKRHLYRSERELMYSTVSCHLITTSSLPKLGGPILEVGRLEKLKNTDEIDRMTQNVV